jgi:hypothetical protein
VTASTDLSGLMNQFVRAAKHVLAGSILAGVATAAGLAIALPSPAAGARKPTKAELKSLTAALNRQNGGVTVTPQFVSISTAAPGWAAVSLGRRPFTFFAFHRKGTQWVLVGDVVPPGKPFDGLCAYVPVSVVVDLFRIHCPPYRALHARRASPAVRKALTAALLADPTIKANGGPSSRVRVWNLCVSRLDSHWAAANVAFPDTGLVAWFHQVAGRWHVFLSWRLPYPPHAPVLSLASCVGYSAAEFGA